MSLLTTLGGGGPETLSKLQPHRTMHLRGFDRRGAAGALHSASSTGFKVSGEWADPADFCVLKLWDADDFFGHLQVDRYHPSTTFGGVVLSFTAALDGVKNPESLHFPTIDWAYLDFSRMSNGSSGRHLLRDMIVGRAGRINATQDVTVSADASSVIYDRVTLSFGRYSWDHIQPGKLSVTFSFFNYHGTGHVHTMTIGAATYNYTQLSTDSSSDVAEGLRLAAAADANASVTRSANQLTLAPIADTGAALSVTAPDDNGPDTLWIAQNPDEVVAEYLTDAVNATSWDAGTPVICEATRSGAVITLEFNADDYGAAEDANAAWIWCGSKTATTTLSPDGFTQIAGAVASTSLDFEVDFDAVFGADVDDIRELWLTFAPTLTTDGSAYERTEWEVAVTDWSTTDPDDNLPLTVAHPSNSTWVGSRDRWATFDGSWVEEAGFFRHGYAKGTSTSGDSVVIKISCQSTFDLYLGTSIYSDRGKVSVSVDGDAATTLDCYLPVEPPSVTRRLLRSNLAPGTHRVVITHTGTKHASSSGYAFYFDFLEAAVLSAEIAEPAQTYDDRSAATDYGTDHAYKLSPERLVWKQRCAGLLGDWNHYLSVFWWNVRRRKGGRINSVEVEFDGWASLAEGATLKLQFGGTSQGDPSATYLLRQYNPLDTDDSLAEYFAHYVNTILVGVRAEASGPILTITSRSPIYDFTFWAFSTGTPDGDMTATGTLAAGNEGIWEVDPTANPVINRAARDWHAAFCAELAANSMTGVIAISQELTSPPDDPDGGQVWAQRYKNGRAVLTSTGFGTEGAGFVEAFSSPTVTMTGHGYITGNTVTITDGSTAASWLIDVVDEDTFDLSVLVAGSHSVAVGDSVLRSLQTTHCAFSSVVSDYLGQAHAEIGDIMVAAGLTPWTQFGEVLHWFFSSTFGRAVTAATNATPIVCTSANHGMVTGDEALITGVRGNRAANGRWVVTVLSSSTFSLDGSVGSGAAVTRSIIGQSAPCVGLLTTGSMAIHDDDQEDAAAVALGRNLNVFHHQDADPSVASYADADFLADRLKGYVDACRTIALAANAGHQFELLYPDDVANATCRWTYDYPYPQGGRFNRHVNLPTDYFTKSGSGLDRLKVEALSWGAAYGSHDLAKQAMVLGYEDLTWAKADVRYLLPWFNGNCPWTMEHKAAVAAALTHVNFWAFDQLFLFSWPLALPSPKAGSRVV